jgi:hypothetical protein
MTDAQFQEMIGEIRAIRFMLEQNFKSPNESDGKPRRKRPLSSKWMTYQQIADHFTVSEATVRLGRGVFGRLRRVPLSEKRVVVLRSDVERLDREMERVAVAIVEDK